MCSATQQPGPLGMSVACVVEHLLPHPLSQNILGKMLLLTNTVGSWFLAAGLDSLQESAHIVAIVASPTFANCPGSSQTVMARSAGLDSLQEVQGEGSGFGSTLSHHPLQGHSPIHAGEEGQRKRSGSRRPSQAIWSCLCCGARCIYNFEGSRVQGIFPCHVYHVHTLRRQVSLGA